MTLPEALQLIEERIGHEPLLNPKLYELDEPELAEALRRFHEVAIGLSEGPPVSRISFSWQEKLVTFPEWFDFDKLRRHR